MKSKKGLVRALKHQNVLVRRWIRYQQDADELTEEEFHYQLRELLEPSERLVAALRTMA